MKLQDAIRKIKAGEILKARKCGWSTMVFNKLNQNIKIKSSENLSKTTPSNPPEERHEETSPLSPLFTPPGAQDDLDKLADALCAQEYARAKAIILDSKESLEDILAVFFREIEDLNNDLSKYESEDFYYD